jgi:hypothetical protein
MQLHIPQWSWTGCVSKVKADILDNQFKYVNRSSLSLSQQNDSLR